MYEAGQIFGAWWQWLGGRARDTVGMASEGPFRGGAPRLIGDDHGVTCARIGERFRRGKI